MSADPEPATPAPNPDEDLRRRLDIARAGGDKRYHAKLKEQNKLFVRERLDRIMDPGWSFEDGLLARHVDGNLPADAVVTVVGNIGGRPVCVIANDITVKAGTWGYRTFQKITAMQERPCAMSASWSRATRPPTSARRECRRWRPARR